jgi:hypothetical protein
LGGLQPPAADDCAAGSREHELKAASILQSQTELAGSGQHDGLTDAGDVDVPVDDRRRLRMKGGILPHLELLEAVH